MNSRIPKIIHMTNKTKLFPLKIIKIWKNLNPDFIFTFSDDTDCYNFIEKNFNKEYADFFKQIKYGPNKADFWRLCKLFIEGGIYTDIDIVPYFPIRYIIKDSTLCSCISINNKSIFQAFLASTPNNIIIKHCIISFINNKDKMNILKRLDYHNINPTIDMYNSIKNILHINEIKPHIIYKLKNKQRENFQEEKVIFLEEFELKNSSNLENFNFIMNNKIKSLYNIYVKNNENKIVLKSRFNGFQNGFNF